MSSRDASFVSSSDSETAETEVEYDLEVEVMSNVSEQKHTSDDDESDEVYTEGRFTRYDFVAYDKLTTRLRHELLRVNQTYNSL